MTDVTQEMILEYILRKGGTVKNVDLVRHFKKYLQVEDPRLKGTYVPIKYNCVQYSTDALCLPVFLVLS